MVSTNIVFCNIAWTILDSPIIIKFNHVENM